MKVYNISNPRKFFEVVDQCKGRVELVTAEGDRLNLKSKLSQFVSLANLFASKDDIPEMEILAADPEDMARLVSYIVEKKEK
ncbi:MAG: polya polymerase [Dorea sp.]|nr:polya polymerase [Dorea sp.]